MSTEPSELDQAIALVDIGRPQQGLLLLQEFVSRNPVNARAVTHVARAHWELGESMKAAQAASRALSIEPASEFALRLLALSCADLGDASTAIGASEEAQRIEPFNWTTHLVRAQVDISLNTASVAGRAASAEAIRLAPDVASTHLVAAYYVAVVDGLRTGASRKEAREHIARVLAIDPQNSRAQALLASVNMVGGRGTANAANMMLDALASDPANPANRARLFLTITSSVRTLTIVFVLLLSLVLGVGRTLRTARPAQFVEIYPIMANVAAIVAVVAAIAVLTRMAWVLRGRALSLLRNVPRVSAVLTIRLISIAIAFIAILLLPFVPFTAGVVIGGAAWFLLLVTRVATSFATKKLAV